jgi:hypothetical protein
MAEKEKKGAFRPTRVPQADPETPQQAPAPAAGQARSTLRIRQDHARTSYSNFTLVTSTPEEVMLGFAVSLMPPGPNREIQVDLSERIVMTYTSAKRLAITLSQVIQRYEAAHGVIPLQNAPAAGPEARIPTPEAQA